MTFHHLTVNCKLSVFTKYTVIQPGWDGKQHKECILNTVHELNLHWSHPTLYLGGECTFPGMLDSKIQNFGAQFFFEFLFYTFLLNMNDYEVTRTWMYEPYFWGIQQCNEDTQGECTVDTGYWSGSLSPVVGVNNWQCSESKGRIRKP